MRVFALLALCFAAVAAVPANPQRIVGGYQILDRTRYPSIAGLMYSSTTTNYRLACAGTILNNRSVLTAAHCTFGDDLSRWRIYVGTSVLFSGGYRHYTNAIINHPDYNPRTFENDIGLVRTYETIVQNLYTRPASISGSNYNIGDNQVVWAAGWGATSEGGTTVRRLRDVQIRTINQEICQERYAEIGGVVTANMICSGLLDVGGRGQCDGDAGAPLFHNDVVVGVFSWSHGCGRPRYPGINTRVSSYTSWIQSNA